MTPSELLFAVLPVLTDQEAVIVFVPRAHFRENTTILENVEVEVLPEGVEQIEGCIYSFSQPYDRLLEQLEELGYAEEGDITDLAARNFDFPENLQVTLPEQTKWGLDETGRVWLPPVR